MSPNNKCVWLQLLVFPCLQTAPTILSYLTITFQNVLQTQTTDPIPAQYNSSGRGMNIPEAHTEVAKPWRQAGWASLASDDYGMNAGLTYTVK